MDFSLFFLVSFSNPSLLPPNELNPIPTLAKQSNHPAKPCQLHCKLSTKSWDLIIHSHLDSNDITLAWRLRVKRFTGSVPEVDVSTRSEL